MNKTVILIGMIVIVSLTVPPALAGGIGQDERPEDGEGPPDPSHTANEALALVEALGLAQIRGLGSPPAVPPAPLPDEDLPDGAGGGIPDVPACTQTLSMGTPCDEQRDPTAEEPTTEEPVDPDATKQAPPAPAVQPPQVPPAEAPEVTPPATVDREAGILGALLAPVQAAAKSASDGARGVLAGVVTTAGFVADEATTQAQASVAEMLGAAGGAATMVGDLVHGLLWTATFDSSMGDGSETETQGADAPQVMEPTNMVTVGLIAVGSIGLIAAGFAVARKLLGLGGIALLSRIPSKDIMKNDTRASIFEIVQSDPGVSLNEIVDRLGLSRNAVAYHLAVFESEKTVVSVKDGKYRRYFVNGGKYVNGAKDVVSTIKNDVTLNVIRYILDHPGAMQKQVCSAVGTSPSATNWHITRLEKVGLVEKAKVANTVRYSPGPSFEKYDLAEFGLATQTAA